MKKIIVKGIVQGVGFRYFTVNQANRCGIKGCVKNLNNGDVEIVVSNPEIAGYRDFVEAVRKGPFSAKVDKVVILEYEGRDYLQFSVER